MAGNGTGSLAGCALIGALVAFGACMTASAPPPVSIPGKSIKDHYGLEAAIGVSFPFDETVTMEDGTKKTVVTHRGKSLFLLSMLSVSVRHSVSDDCDIGAVIGGARFGGDVRCGITGEDRGVYISSGAYWLPLYGVQGRTELQAGVTKNDSRESGVFGFATAGLAYGSYEHRAPLEGLKLSQSTLSSPPDPSIRIKEAELAWTASGTFGYRYEGIPFGFVSFSVEVPFATSTPDLRCAGCDEPMVFTDYDPGWRLGVTAGGPFVLSVF